MSNGYLGEDRSVTDWPSRWKRKAIDLRDIDWPNFRRNESLMRAIQTKEKMIPDLLKRCEEMGVPEYMWEDSKVGNPAGKDMDGRFVTATSLRHAIVAHRISKFLTVTEPLDLDVLEVGGGFGSMARMLNNHLPVQSYTFIDAKPMLSLQKRYMEMLGKPIEVMNFIPNDKFDEHRDLRFDLFVNTNSLGEMPVGVVGEYFSYIQETMNYGGMFYSWNRKFRDTHYDEYPFDDQWKFLSVTEHQFLVPWIESIALRT